MKKAERKKISGQGGFSLAELVVGLFIIALISGLFMANYHNTNKRSQLNMERQKMASNIRVAQNNSLSSKTYDGTNMPAGGWGVHFAMSDTSHYIIFADQDGDERYNNDVTKDLAKEIKTLPEGVTIKSLSLAEAVDSLDVVFYPPDPVTYLNGLDNQVAMIVLQDNVNNSTGTVLVNFFGLIDTE